MQSDEKAASPQRNEAGFALCYALVIAGFLGLLAMLLLSRTSANSQSAGRQCQRVQAFYLAEAAIQQGIALISQAAILTYPYTERATPLGTGSYSLAIQATPCRDGTTLYALKGYGLAGNSGRVIYVVLHDWSIKGTRPFLTLESWHEA